MQFPLLWVRQFGILFDEFPELFVELFGLIIITVVFVVTVVVVLFAVVVVLLPTTWLKVWVPVKIAWIWSGNKQ